MDTCKEVKEFKILGHNIRLKESNDNDMVSPQEIVDYVRNEINEIRGMAGNLAESQIAVLVALKLAEEKISLDRDYKKNISSLEMTAKSALKLVEEVSPTSH